MIIHTNHPLNHYHLLLHFQFFGSYLIYINLIMKLVLLLYFLQLLAQLKYRGQPMKNLRQNWFLTTSYNEYLQFSSDLKLKHYLNIPIENYSLKDLDVMEVN